MQNYLLLINLHDNEFNMHVETVTHKIFDMIESKFFTNKKQLVDTVSEVLHLQPSSIYKKIKGESSISLEEAEILAKHFRISLDEILGLSEDKIYFDFPALYGAVKDHRDFIDPIRQDLENLRLLNPIIYYSTKELPLFYYFLFPKLKSFKFYVFFNFNWRLDETIIKPYEENDYCFDEEFNKITRRILDLYSEINSIEIWTTSVLDNTFNQLRYLSEAGLIKSRVQALEILDDVDRLIDTIAEIIKSKNKSVLKDKNGGEPGSIELYNNEILHTNNIIYVKSTAHEAVYNTYDNPNFMRSISPVLCQFTNRWFERIIQNSVPVSFGNIKDQNAFISRTKEKSIRCRSNLNNIFDHRENPDL
ncbi:MAG: helix-turn-helix domain-containing protein [Saprospiraceae bacterium]